MSKINKIYPSQKSQKNSKNRQKLSQEFQSQYTQDFQYILIEKISQNLSINNSLKTINSLKSKKLFASRPLILLSISAIHPDSVYLLLTGLFLKILILCLRRLKDSQLLIYRQLMKPIFSIENNTIFAGLSRVSMGAGLLQGVLRLLLKQIGNQIH